uniref:SRCR domain-containing protein n=1 Tax=Tetraodon nigroviridis TaxID=99883 RepID=H3CEX2_TETNG
MRLVNGTDRCSGRVEIRHNDRWGAVCDDNWDIRDAQVVCRAMDCGSAQTAKSNAYFGRGEGEIWLDEVDCRGNETSLLHCNHPGLGENNCGHGEDAGVICSDIEAECTNTTGVTVQTCEGVSLSCAGNPLRLVNGTDRCSGRVEIRHNHQWGVCDDEWQLPNGDVVCRELGCGHAVSAPTSAHFGRGTGPIWLDNVKCTGQETTLTHCSHNTFGDHNCGHGEDAGVICSDMPQVRHSTCGKECSLSLRLVNGTDQCSGRVEIRHNDLWGTVCDDEWQLPNGDVVCRELGCGHAVSAPTSAHFGRGTGPIWLDNVKCTGQETTLTQCSHNNFGDHNCGHGEDAGVICSEHKKSITKETLPMLTRAACWCRRQSGNPLRLVNGTDRCSGRVEIRHNHQWGTVCDDEWQLPNGDVVCRELGCGHAVSAPTSAHFGRGTGPIWLDNVKCTGQETTLTHCSHNTFGDHNCGHGEDAGVICSGNLLRLVNGTNRCSGRVEIRHNDQWGTVCDDNWDIRDAQVVCRAMDCGSAQTAKSNAYFGQGKGDIWLDEVDCRGNETSLLHCNHARLGHNNCGHGEDAGVICSGIRHVKVFLFHVQVRHSTCGKECSMPLRLINGTYRCSGRVEIRHNDRWGTVCDDNWDIRDAQVVCRAMDCGSAQTAKSNAYFGQGKGDIWLDDVDCQGNETSLLHCNHTRLGKNNCGHGEDAGVICSDIQSDYSFWNTKRASLKKPYLCNPLRLVNGTGRCSGRVEIQHNDLWGTVCDDEWQLPNGDVVCRELGCGHAVSAPTSAHFGRGTGPIWLDNVKCTGQETTLTQCSHNNFGDHNCGHGEDAGVICSDYSFWNTKRASLKKHLPMLTRELSSGNPLRLVNGTNRCSGRVEIQHNDLWGTVCDDEWQLPNGDVVCRELGCGHAVSAPTSAHFGRATGPIWLDNVKCTGQEATLTQCSHNNFGDHNCGHGEDAGVICSVTPHIEVECTNTTGVTVQTCEGVSLSCAGNPLRLVNGTDRCSGRVEIRHNDLWGTVCDDEWQLPNAVVVCRELGCGHAVSAPTSAHFGRGTGPIWLDNVKCTGQETTLTQCPHNTFGDHNCGHGEDAGVICSASRRSEVTLRDDTDERSAAVFDGREKCDKVRLTGGSRCSGRVEIYHQDSWGTVCDDRWNLPNADVVCREVKCGTALEAKKSAFFGEGKDRIWLDDVQCSGQELSILKCAHREFGENNCGHGEDAGVICSGKEYKKSITKETLPMLTCAACWSSPPLRLVNGTDRCSGRVEIRHNDRWGTVCDDKWDIRDAQVVCRAMDCGSAQTAKSNAYFGQGEGDIWLDDVDCRGNETSLLHCNHPGLGKNNCGHGEDAGVICSGWSTAPTNALAEWRSGTTTGGVRSGNPLRLINGTDRCSGRVEIRHNDQWGVCDDEWQLPNGDVVCRELGCGHAVSAPTSAHFGRGTGPIWLDNVKCTGQETTLTQCPHNTFGDHNCGHDEDAGVICSGETLQHVAKSVCRVQTNLFLMRQSDFSYNPLRLVNGTDRCSGRVEIRHNDRWGTVCDDNWDIMDAQVVCRAMDCGSAKTAKSNAYFGQGEGDIWLDDVDCQGNEMSLLHCNHPGLGKNNCGHGEDAGVICSGWSTAPTDALAEWRSGTTTGGGRSVMMSGSCPMATCHAVSAPTSAHFGRGTGPIWLDNVSGFTDLLLILKWNVQIQLELQFRHVKVFLFHVQVRHSTCGKERMQSANKSFFMRQSDYSFWNTKRASLKKHCLCNPLRLVNGTDRCSGRVEIRHNDLWGTVCDDEWQLPNAVVVCRELGCGHAVSAPTSAHFGRGTGPIWLDNVKCTGQETTLTHCPHNNFGDHNCGHDEDAGVICSG